MDQSITSPKYLFILEYRFAKRLVSHSLYHNPPISSNPLFDIIPQIEYALSEENLVIYLKRPHYKDLRPRVTAWTLNPSPIPICDHR